MKKSMITLMIMILVLSTAAIPVSAATPSDVAVDNANGNASFKRTVSSDETTDKKHSVNGELMILRLVRASARYSPNLFDPYLEAFGDHILLHEELISIKEQLKNTYTEDELREITVEVREEMTEWIEENGNDRDVMTETLQALKDAVENGNTEEIESLLQQLYEMVLIHINVDQHRVDVISSYLAAF